MEMRHRPHQDIDSLHGINSSHNAHEEPVRVAGQRPSDRWIGWTREKTLQVDSLRHNPDTAGLPVTNHAGDSRTDRNRCGRQPGRHAEELSTQARKDQIVELNDHRSSGQPAGQGSVQVRPQAVGVDQIKGSSGPSDEEDRSGRGQQLGRQRGRRRSTIGIVFRSYSSVNGQLKREAGKPECAPLRFQVPAGR
jgi:hypothetical protein